MKRVDLSSSSSSRRALRGALWSSVPQSATMGVAPSAAYMNADNAAAALGPGGVPEIRYEVPVHFRIVLKWVGALGAGSAVAVGCSILFMSISKSIADGRFCFLTDALNIYKSMAVVLAATAGGFLVAAKLASPAVFTHESELATHASIALTAVWAAMLGVAIQTDFGSVVHYVTVALLVVAWLCFYAVVIWLEGGGIIPWSSSSQQQQQQHSHRVQWWIQVGVFTAATVFLIVWGVLAAVFFWAAAAPGRDTENVRTSAGVFEHLCLGALLVMDFMLGVNLYMHASVMGAATTTADMDKK
jgi:hypothetical protein